MTTEVHERLVAPQLAPRSPRGARAWLVFLVTVLLAAIAIGVVAALLGNAVRGVDTASAGQAQAQASLAAAQDQLAAAEQAEADARAAIETRRQEILDELAAQPREAGFSSIGSSQAFAELQAMEDGLETDEAATVAARTAADDASAAVSTAADQVVAARQEAERLVAPLWITIAASAVVLALVLWLAIAKTRRGRRASRRS